MPIAYNISKRALGVVKEKEIYKGHKYSFSCAYAAMSNGVCKRGGFPCFGKRGRRTFFADAICCFNGGIDPEKLFLKKALMRKGHWQVSQR